MENSAINATAQGLDHQFPCENCGSDMRYAPKKGSLYCDHCGHEEHILNPPQGWHAAERPLEQGLAESIGQDDFEESLVKSCRSCGAEIALGENHHANQCPYCASPFAVEPSLNRHFRPQAILPFIIDEQQARVTLAAWLSSRWFAPSALSNFARTGRKMQGIYVPFWTFDAQTQTDYKGRRGDAYYVTVGSGDNRRTERRIRWRSASGRVKRFFDDVLIFASKHLPLDDINNLAPWELSAIEPYNQEFLAGYQAESYSVPLEEAWSMAQNVMKQQIIRDIKFDIGGDRQIITSMDAEIWDKRFKHILLPVYSHAYHFRGKTYRCLINAQTGRVTGARPYSPWKIAFASLAALIIAGAIAYFYTQTQ